MDVILEEMSKFFGGDRDKLGSLIRYESIM